MLNILFFGQLRERLKTDKLSVDITTLGSQPTVYSLREYLAKSDILWQKLLSSGQCLVAVNQTMATDETQLHSHDEVAFFPPVTGG